MEQFCGISKSRSIETPRHFVVLDSKERTNYKSMPMFSAVLFFLSLSSNLALAEGPSLVARPPQYVVFAFDGSKMISMWKETRQFAKDMSAGKYASEMTPQNPQLMPLQFTYFINADYFLADEFKDKYIAPQFAGTHGEGQSAIGFGGSVDYVKERYAQTNMAYAEGNEIANHAAGHWDGSRWTREEWHSEFQQFYDILQNIFSYNGIDPTTIVAALRGGWKFDMKEMIGFRAPQLGEDADMYAELPNAGGIGNIKYDTSKYQAPSEWPYQKDGLWYFPLAVVKIAGTTSRTLSMDYNFYRMQSGAEDVVTKITDPALQAEKIKEFEDQMFYSYVDYFFGNYNGNRAPVNIGHHFSKWNGGAYWNAMRRIARLVCGLPEVKCVTYRDLMNFMASPETQKNLAAYKAGKFPATRYTAYPRHPSRQDGREMLDDIRAPHLVYPEDYLQSDPPEAHEE